MARAVLNPNETFPFFPEARTMKTLSKLALSLVLGLATPACSGANAADDVRADDFSTTSQAQTVDPAATQVRVGTWNVKRLGQGSKRLDLVAGVIEANFDVVALQEVMTPAGLAALMANLPGWSSTLSERAVGENGYFEYYAILTRDGAATVTSNAIVADAADEWAREPMVTCLKAQNADFCLVSTHVIFGDTVGPRDAEIQALARLVTNLRNTTPNESDYIVVGDFNRSGSARSFNTFSAQGFGFSDDGLTRTTISALNGYVNPYDHVLFDKVVTNEWAGIARRVDILAGACGGSSAFCAGSVSDHAPLAITLNTAGVDDD
jgi:endonuclease/exonuclease/phosphatase family metal-dependent hydrolase